MAAAGPPEAYVRYLAMLRGSERLPPRELARRQLRQVEWIVRHAAATTPLYAGRLAPVLDGDRFNPRGWDAVPILTRAEAHAAGDRLQASSVPAAAGEVGYGETSGSTGIPLRYGWTDSASTATRMQLERFWDWHGIDPSGSFAEIRVHRGKLTGRDNVQRNGWSFRSQAGPFAAMCVSQPLDRQVSWLCAVAPDYLLTYPTHAVALAQAVRAAGRPLSLQAVVTVGEVLTSEARRAIAFGFAGDRMPALVLDTYGCQEAGKLALACPAGRYHVCAESVLLEIVDDAGAPVGPGGEGWVVVTSLFNYATPFVRYRLGDRAIAGDGEPCPCGRTLPVIARILGRARNMLIMPDGTRRWPSSQIALGMRRFVAFRQFQVVQTERRRIELRYVPDEDAPPPDSAGLAAFVAQALHPEIAIALRPVAEIPRSAGGKFEDYVCLVRD